MQTLNQEEMSDKTKGRISHKKRKVLGAGNAAHLVEQGPT